MTQPIRKNEREVKDLAEIANIFDRCPVLRIAFVDRDYPYIVPVHYGYLLESGCLTFYIHSAQEGRKIELARRSPKIAFETDRLLGIGRSDKPCGWTSHYESVFGEGLISFVRGEEKKKGIDLLMRRYGFTGPFSYDMAVFAKTEVMKIEPTSLSAKRNVQK